MSIRPETSWERTIYLQRLRRQRWLILTGQIGFLFLFLLLWEVAAQLRWIDPFITSQPSRVALTLLHLHQDGSLYLHIYVTLMETFYGFILGTGGGMLLAVLLWWSPLFNRIADPYLVVLNALPKVALGPLLIVWLGNGSSAIIGMALFISVIVTIISMVSGFQEVDAEKIKLLKAFGASRLQILGKVILPGSLPSMITAVKVNVGLCLVGVIMGEFLVSRAGLGYLIVYGGQVFKLDLVMSSILVLAVMAALMYGLVSYAEGKLLRWQK